jgi:urease accessory protein
MASPSQAPAPEARKRPVAFAAEPLVSPRSPEEAALALDFVRDSATGHTILASSHQQPPLKVVRAFPRDDGSALAHLHNVSGGLLGGDRLALSVRVGHGANVQLTTTGATRVYRPGPSAAEAIQANEIDVAPDALLEYVPDAIIPFAGSRFSQRTTVRLAEDSSLFWWEIVAPGREASGELFACESLEIKTDILARDKIVANERVRLAPRQHAASSPARFGAFRHWATFYICHVGRDPASWLSLENELRQAAAMLHPRGRTLWGISTLVADGLVVRCLAERGCDIAPGLDTLWRAAKLALHNTEPILPRKIR